MQAREINILHLVEIDHALLNFLVPGHPGLLLVSQLGDHLGPFNGIVFPIHGHEVSVQRDCLSYSTITMISFGVSLGFEIVSQ